MITLVMGGDLGFKGVHMASWKRCADVVGTIK